MTVYHTPGLSTSEIAVIPILSLTFGAIYVYLHQNMNVPTKFIKDSKDKNPRSTSVYALHIANMISWLHGPVVSIWAFYVYSTDGVTYNESNPASCVPMLMVRISSL